MKKNITVATFNINGLMSLFQPNPGETGLVPYSLRHIEICRQLEESDVDIINFQEIFTYSNLRLIRKNLPSYPYVSYRPFIFGPRGALVTFSKTPIRTVGFKSFFWPSFKAKRTGLPKGTLLRSALKGILIVEAKTVLLTVINTHVTYNGDLNWTEDGKFYDIEKAQLDKISQMVAKLTNSKPKNALILCGDLNLEADSPLYRHFVDKVWLNDLFAGDNASTFHNEYVSGGGFKHRIDYILANNQSVSSETKRIFTQKVNIKGQEVHLSDHIGLKASTDISAPKA